MGRLIDADALIDLFTKDKELLQRGFSKDSKFAYMTADYVIKTISEQPTAYDVDNIVAELESRKELLNIAKMPNTQKNVGQNAYNIAIDIVEAGGVNEEMYM